LNESKFKPRDKKVASLEAGVQKAVTALRDSFDFLNDGLVKVEDKLNRGGGSTFGPQDLTALEGKLDDLKREVTLLISNDDVGAIKFCGLGFRNTKEAEAYILKEMPSHSYGLIVDAHMIMEHVYELISNRSVLDQLYKIHKIKIDNVNDGIAITSFETAMPKFFFKQTGDYKVIAGAASYFNSIKTFDEWDVPHVGFRDYFRTKMGLVNSALQRSIMEGLAPGTPIYSVAMTSLNSSIAWMEAFFMFIDKKYAELTLAKFGKVAAWSLTTRLATRIFEDIAEPRSGVVGTLSIGGNMAICPRVFWSVIQSHDVMESFKSAAFIDHPSISSEYVKFLSVNTGIEAIHKLEATVSTLQDQAVVQAKAVRDATTAASSASNKADEAKRLVAALEKRLSKLESKK
jgi:hypothetical protein